MRRVAILALLASLLAPGAALADDALIDVGMAQAWMRLSPLGNRTAWPTGIVARWMFVDGHGEVALGGKLTAWKSFWGEDDGTLGLDLEFNASFGGRFKGHGAHVSPCGGFAVGLRNLLVRRVATASEALSGLGATVELGAHGYFGDDSGFYWRLVGFASAHLLFPDPGWMAGGGVQLTLGIYMD
jgi:hypothetical protein